MTGPARLLDRPAPEGVRRIALGFLDAADEAGRRLSGEGAPDAEALHDYRVAIRRLRSTLRAYRPVLGDAVRRKQERELRGLTRLTGRGRDAEVQVAWLADARGALGPEGRAAADRLAAELGETRDSGYEAAVASVTARFRPLETRLRSRLRCLHRIEGSGAVPEPAVRSLAAAVDRILPALAASLEEALGRVRTSDDREEAHRARIRGKRVRYLLEPLAPEVEGVPELVERLKDLQDTVGDLRDLHLLEERLAGSEALAGAEELVALLRSGQRERFAGFLGRWTGEAADRFFAELDAVRHRLAAAAPDAIEIERKYLLTGRPAGLETARKRELEQGYLPGTRVQERLRRIRDGEVVRHVRSIKTGAGVVRTEVQEEIDEALFEKLWPLTEGRRVRKRRYAAHGGGLLWEVDEFLDRELWLAEVEIPSADYEPGLPDWLAPFVVREVTDEPEYLNVNLAR